MHYDGLFKLFPCRIAARTPERLDSDPVLIVNLSCCASPSSCGCGRQSVEACIQQELVNRGFSKDFLFSPWPHTRGAPAAFPFHSVSSSYVPPPAPAAPETAPEDRLVAAPEASAVAPREGERTTSPGDDLSPIPEAASVFKDGPRNAD